MSIIVVAAQFVVDDVDDVERKRTVMIQFSFLEIAMIALALEYEVAEDEEY